jgi:hypothetical protein
VLLELLHRGPHRRRADHRPLGLRNDPHTVFAAEARERLAALGSFGAFERRAKRFQLHDLGFAELPRKQRGAIAIEQESGRQRSQRDDDDQQ